LKYVKFVKGIKAIRNGFKIGNSLYINGRWIVIGSKYTLIGESLSKPLKKALVSSIKNRRDIDDIISYYQNERTIRNTVYKTDPIKKARLQKRKELDNERKKDLYIKPDDI
jgi:hypothetical protein